MSLGAEYTGYWVTQGDAATPVPEADASWSFALNETLAEDSAITTISGRHCYSSGTRLHEYWNATPKVVLHFTADVSVPIWQHDDLTGANWGLFCPGHGQEGTGNTQHTNHTLYSPDITAGAQYNDVNLQFSFNQATPTTYDTTEGIIFAASTNSGQHYNDGGYVNMNTTSKGYQVQHGHAAVQTSTQRYWMMRLYQGLPATTTQQCIYDVVFDMNTASTGITTYAVTQDGGGVGAFRHIAFIESEDNYWHWSIHSRVSTNATGSNTRCIWYLGDGPDIADHTGSWSGPGTGDGICFWRLDQTTHQSPGIMCRGSTNGDTQYWGWQCSYPTSDITGWTHTNATMYNEWRANRAVGDPAGDRAYDYWICPVAYGKTFGSYDGDLHVWYIVDEPSAGTGEQILVRLYNSTGTQIVNEFFTAPSTLEWDGPNGDYVHRTAIAWNNDDVRVAWNGVMVATVTTASGWDASQMSSNTHIAPTGRRFGGNAATTSGFALGQCSISEHKIWTSKLTDEELESLTAF